VIADLRIGAIYRYRVKTCCYGTFIGWDLSIMKRILSI